MIPRDLEAVILRLHFAEKWPVGTISIQLGVHHEVVERVIRQDLVPPTRRLRPSGLDAYIGFVMETWEKYPKLPASRLWVMCRERGYTGTRDHFRHAVRPFRPLPRREVFLRLSTLPGEQAQFDWAHFEHVVVGKRGRRQLLAFVGVLSYSRAVFARFYFDQKVENLLRGHEAVFSAWGGVPRVALYDNPKTIVVERVGQAIRFNEHLLGFSGHYRYEPRPVPPRRPNEKGRVERAIRYLRSGFFYARKWRDIDDLNDQVAKWCMGCAMERPWPEDPTKTVGEVFREEREKLFPLPDEPYPTDERKETSFKKTPYLRFDGNDYSVPHTLVGRTLVLLADLETVRVFHGTEEVARHTRSFDKGQVIEDQRHIEELLERKSEAREHRGMDRLAYAAPSTRDLLARLAERGKNLGSATAKLLELLDAYGADSLEAAVEEVLLAQAPHVPAVRQVLERERRARGLGPVHPISLPDDPRVRDIRVRPHKLSSYDAIRETEEDGHDGHADAVPAV